jgi:CHAT domain-containing protein
VLSEDEAKRVKELEQKIAELRQAGKYAEAQRSARAIVELRARAQGTDHWETADARRMLQTLEQIAALPAEAQAELNEATQEHARASQLYRQGRYADAVPLLKRSLDIRRRHLGAEHADVAKTISDLALLLDQSARYADAEPLHRQALALYRKTRGEDHPDTASCCDRLALDLNAQGKYAEGEPLLRQALAIRRRVLGDDHPHTAVSYVNVAYHLDDRGQYAAAEPLHRQALAIFRKTLGEDHGHTAAEYANLASNLDAQGKYAMAEPLHRQALAIRRKVVGEEHPHTAASYTSVAGNLDGQGKHAEAEALFRQALTICRNALGEEHPHTAASYNNLARNLHAQGKYAAAEPLFRKALTIKRKVLGEEHPDTAASYINLAWNLKAQRKYAEAEPLARQTLAVLRKTWWDDHPETAASYDSVARILYAQGQYADAEPLARQALAIRRRTVGEGHPDTAASYDNVAFTLYAQGKVAQAEELWRAAARSFETARLAISFSGLDRATFSAQISPLLPLAACLARRGKAVDAWTSWEADLARGLFDDLSARLARRLSENERHREQELLGKRLSLDKQLAALLQLRDPTEAHGRQVERLQKERDALLVEATAFEAELAKTHGPAAGQVYDLARIQAALPADAALVGWIDAAGQPRAADPNGEHWACLVRQRGEPVWVQLPGSGAKQAWTQEDDDLPAKVQNTLVEPPDEAGAQRTELTGQLYRQRLAPLAKHLGATKSLPTVRHLIILPSAWMAGVPLEALIEARTDKQPAYAISYAPSGTMFAWLQERKQEAVAKGGKPDVLRLLALGDPVFARPRDGTKPPPPLPGTRREVEAIARLFDRAEKLLGSQASEQQLQELAASGHLRDYGCLHLATHGVVDPQSALHSALLLSQDKLPDPLRQALAGKKAYDGRLTAGQILHTWQLDAELVTLSACRTGLGKYEGGEGYLGFAQALFLAGGRSLVLSLWKVDDNATALLMTRFYQNLLGKRKGLDKPLAKAEALQEAKAWLRGLTSKEVDQRLAELPRGPEVERPTAPARAAVHPYAHPYYWAAFILIGDPTAFK